MMVVMGEYLAEPVLQIKPVLKGNVLPPVALKFAPS